MAEDNKRTDSARAHDDSDLINSMEEAPSQGGVSGGNLQRDIASQAEEEHDARGKPGITRVQKGDKANSGDMPNLPNRS